CHSMRRWRCVVTTAFDGGLLRGDKIVRLVYLDEAGISNPKDEPFLVIAGIAVNSNGREEPKHQKMTKDEMVEWFRSAPMGSRHERMLWATRKIAHLTGAAEGGAYKRLLIAMIEAEGRLDPREFKDCA